MKALILLIALTSVSSLAADGMANSMTQDAIQQNESVNSPTSVMSNTQVNSGTTFDSYGGGVTCARATWQMGAIGTAASKYTQGAQLYVGISGPIGSGSDCKDAAKLQNYLNRTRTQDLKERIRRTNLTHAADMKKQELLYADLLAKVCENQHSKVVALEGSFMDSACDTYKTISHHKPSYDTEKYHRVSGH